MIDGRAEDRVAAHGREYARRKAKRREGLRLAVCRESWCLYEHGPIAWTWPLSETSTRPCPRCTRPLSPVSAHDWGGTVRPHPGGRRGPRTGEGRAPAAKRPDRCSFCGRSGHERPDCAREARAGRRAQATP